MIYLERKLRWDFAQLCSKGFFRTGTVPCLTGTYKGYKKLSFSYSLIYLLLICPKIIVYKNLKTFQNIGIGCRLQNSRFFSKIVGRRESPIVDRHPSLTRPQVAKSEDNFLVSLQLCSPFDIGSSRRVLRPLERVRKKYGCFPVWDWFQKIPLILA